MFSSVDTCWVLVAAFLVYFMQAGFALCEAGFTRAKNTGNILMKNMMDFCIGTPCYWLIGFGLMFGGTSALIGGFDPFIQGDYSRLWQALPGLKHLTIQGSTGLKLGNIEHAGLESLEIICGGLPMDVLKSIAQAKLPDLRKLVLYLGVDEYGFDGSVEEIEAALAEMHFPKLEYLGLLDSEMQDELVPVALACPLAKQLTTLDLSCGTLTDKGGALLLAGVVDLPKLQKLDLHHHFLSDEMMAKLSALPITVDVSEQNTPDEYDGELYYYALITE